MAEQNGENKKDSSQKPAIDASKKDEKDEKDMDEFEKKWADIEYLIRKPFCCK